MDLYTIALTLHLVSFGWNITWVVISDAVGLLWILGKLSRVPEKFLKATHTLIWAGLILSVITGAYLFSTVSAYLLTVPAFYSKLLLVLALIGNAYFIGRHITVASNNSFKELSQIEKRRLLVSGFVSTAGWIGVFISAQFLGL